MLIAKTQDGQVLAVADYRSLFPNTSFPASGPSPEFMAENSCMTVTVFKPYDANTQKLIPADPYIEGNTVYTVQVVELTPEEIAAREADQRAGVKSSAELLLQQTDWTATVDVADPQYSDPYLGNQSEFLAYRSAVRKIALNPPVTVSEWPIMPEEVWTPAA